MIETIALDLEGTLISNAMSQIPRPGLYEFLEGCKAITPRIVIYTTVNESRFFSIANTLAEEKFVPDWFRDIEYIKWPGLTKDLYLVPGVDLKTTVLVDDCHQYVHPGQQDQWVEVAQFSHPYRSDDKELSRALREIKTRLA